MLTPIIREDFLYYVWKTKNFSFSNLKTTSGDTLEIIEFGNQNFDSGPDFSNGKVKINDTIWAGNIEMHVYSSDWERHCHDLDKAYDNVVLHVVFEHDKEVFTSSENQLPCLEMNNRISRSILKNYAGLISGNTRIPCAQNIHKVDAHVVQFWLQRLIAERIESKTTYLKEILESTRFDWEETLFIYLSRYMGARVNKEPFEALSRTLSYKLIQKNNHDLHRVEALLFGQSGMLQANFEDEYFVGLKNEFGFLAKKYGLKPIPVVSWKFARMRPAGFPTIRIAQFAKIISGQNRLFSQIIHETDMQTLRDIFRVEASPYWNKHYRFGTMSGYKIKKVGEAFIDQIFINVLCPVIFLYGLHISDEKFCERAIAHLDAIKSENNKISREFKELGIVSKSASDSQALIQLKKNYCDNKSCMSCSIGNEIIKKE